MHTWILTVSFLLLFVYVLKRSRTDVRERTFANERSRPRSTFVEFFFSNLLFFRIFFWKFFFRKSFLPIKIFSFFNSPRFLWNYFLSLLNNTWADSKPFHWPCHRFCHPYVFPPAQAAMHSFVFHRSWNMSQTCLVLSRMYISHQISCLVHKTIIYIVKNLFFK